MEAGIEELKELFYKDRLQEAYKKLRQLQTDFNTNEEFQSHLSSLEEVRILIDDLKKLKDA